MAGTSISNIATWLDDPAEPEKPEAVYGTGGEPLMALDLVDAVFRPLAERDVATRLVTNGTLLDDRRVARLVDMGLSGVKVTYNTLQSERLLALMKGAHEKDVVTLLDNIRRAKDAGLWVFIRMGLGRHNHDEIVPLYRTMRDLGVDVFQIKPWIPSGLAAENQAALSLSPNRLVDTFADAMAELYDEISDGRGPEVTVSCYPPAREMGFTVKDCANVAKIYAEPCGHALICNFSDEYLGSWYPEEGGFAACVARRRELYPQIMDDHGVASCPARLNWSTPTSVVSPAPQWKAEAGENAAPFIPLTSLSPRA